MGDVENRQREKEPETDSERKRKRGRKRKERLRMREIVTERKRHGERDAEKAGRDSVVHSYPV